MKATSLKLQRCSPRRELLLPAMLLVAASFVPSADAGDIGHYNPGVLNIRDLLVPAEPGVYAALYQYYYTTNRLNDANGREIETININPGPGPGLDIDIDVDVGIYAMAPTLIWVSPWKILGATYAAYISPSFANTSVNAQLASQTQLGLNASNDNFGVGDMIIQPIWLGWSVTRFDAALGYGFYAPTGQYDTAPVTLANGATVRVESPDNIGYGYWTHQFQVAGALYPWPDKRLAIVLASTYEVNHEKEGYDLTAGDVVTINWGLSQYLPIRKDMSLLAEIGLGGYDCWQVASDDGSDARNGVRDSVHAVGGQIGLTHVPWGAVLNFHYYYEYEAEDRFQGHAIGLSIAKKVNF